MPAETHRLSDNTLEWSGRVWSKLTQQQCAGILWIALRYDQARAPANTITYIETMAGLAWAELGRTLQTDLAKTLQQLFSLMQQR